MSFVPVQEAQNFEQVITCWSRLGGICSSTPHSCSMACVAVDHPYIDDNNPISGRRFTFQFNTTTTCPTRSTPILSQQMNKPPSNSNHLEQPFAFKPPKRNKSPPSKETSTGNLTTASLTHPPNKLSSFHNLHHTLVRTSCSQAVKLMRLRIVAFVSQLPED